jgi:peroxiredoxin Q/BCP
LSEIAVGQPAPDFTLPALTKEGERNISLAEFRGVSKVVLYFYPKDDTPGCTKEACAFRDLSSQFRDAGAVILGASPDDLRSHGKFAEKYGLPFPLIADPGHVAAMSFGVWKEKMNYGKTYWGIERTTFVIDTAGMVANIYPKVKVEEHTEKVLDFVRSLG